MKKKKLTFISISILFTFIFLIGCSIPAFLAGKASNVKPEITAKSTPVIINKTSSEVMVRVKVQSDQNLAKVVEDLNKIYGKPTVEISAFQDDNGRTIVMKKLYYVKDKQTFVVVSVVNDKVLLIDTVHVPRGG